MFEANSAITASTRRSSSLLRRSSNLLEVSLAAFQAWRTRQKLRTVLHGLSDRDLQDIGTTRGEIDYIASNRSIDPRGIRSATMYR